MERVEYRAVIRFLLLVSETPTKFEKTFVQCLWQVSPIHYNDVIMGAMAYQITSLTIVYSNVYSGTDQRKHQSSASLAFVGGIHRWPVNSLHKWPVTRKIFVNYSISLSSLCKLIWRHWTYKMPVRYILSSMWIRLSTFSQLSIIKYMGLCVFSLSIFLVMIEIIYTLSYIIIKSEVWTIIHCLELGHETMVRVACFSIFLWGITPIGVKSLPFYYLGYVVGVGGAVRFLVVGTIGQEERPPRDQLWMKQCLTSLKYWPI